MLAVARAQARLKTTGGTADAESTMSPDRLHALLALSRALQSARDPGQVAATFADHAGRLTTGEVSMWLWDADRDRLVGHADGAEVERVLDRFPECADALETARAVRTEKVFVLPLVVDGTPAGVLEVHGASPAELASGGMQYWTSLAAVAAGALASAMRFAELTAAEQRFRSLVEQLPVVTYVDRADNGDPIYTSPQLEAQFGVSTDEWLDGSDGWGRSIHPDDRELATTSYDAAVAQGLPYSHEYRLIGCDGTVRWVCDEARQVVTEDGTAVVQGVIYDITDRKRADERFREAEARYRTLVEQLPLAIYIDSVDGVGTSIYNSPQNETITGYSDEQWLSDPGLFACVIDPDDRERVLGGFERAMASASRSPTTTGWCARTAPRKLGARRAVIVRDKSATRCSTARATCSTSPAASRRRSACRTSPTTTR